MSQLAILADELSVWREAGYGSDDLELWAVGYPGQQDAVEELLAEMPEGYDGVIQVDTVDVEAWGGFAANVNDLFVIDRDGEIVEKTNLAVDPLTVDENLLALDTLVRGQLE